MSDAVQRLQAVKAEIASAARAAERDPADVELVAVSKTFDAAAIRPTLEAGHRVFGENRVQESAEKWPGLRADFTDVELHLIGPLQSNKAREAVALFDVIQTVDREKIARSLAREMSAAGKKLPVFVQVNTGDEPQKAGIAAGDVEPFCALCRDELGLDVRGLMCIPPVDEEPAIHFGFLATLAARVGLPKLSMGMSADHETAVAFGATHVRVGSAIFGARTRAVA
ncbi:MAG: YggS family pyridoxal phosphate-dependent enzyme [Pseudomonadota bacterium]